MRQIAAGTRLAGFLDSLLQLAVFVAVAYVQATHARWIHFNAWASCYSLGQLQLPNLNMDTPLSLSLTLSIALSIFNMGLYGLASSQTKTHFASTSFLTVVMSGDRYLDIILKRHGAASFARLFGLRQQLDLGTVIVEERRKVDNDDTDEAVETVLTQCSMSFLAPLDVYHISLQDIIPCDSYVLRGKSLIDESNMTGESMPDRKTFGSLLMSGTLNLSAKLVAVVLK